MNIFFIGIAGAGMHSLALYLSDAGHRIWGSDPGATQEVVDFWARRGGKVYLSHDAENIRGAEMVIYSSAVPGSNPELCAARELGIACGRGEALARFANQHRRSIAVCGTHGKGTTAAAISFLCRESGMRTSEILGAIPIGSEQPAQFVSESDVLVCEVDESDRSHTYHRPGILVINNVEEDHLNQYRDLEDILDTFAGHVKDCLEHGSEVIIHYAGIGAPGLYCRLGEYGAIHWVAEEGTLESPALGYVLGESDDHGRCMLTLRDAGGNLAQCRPSLGGEANARNLATAAMVGRILGIELERSADILKGYCGLKDRCEIQEIGGLYLVTDYASHPTCVRNDIKWMRHGADHVFVVYHPYRYSLMQCHWGELVDALCGADEVFILPFDPCGEAYIENISSSRMAEDIVHKGGHATAFETFELCLEAAAGGMHRGDRLIVFAGHPAFEMARVNLEKRAGVLAESR